MKPAWCPHHDCVWLIGGAEHEDSGSMCGGKLPSAALHRTTENTHRLCIKGCDDPPIDLQVNKSDLWYFGRFVNKMREAIQPEDKGDGE